ncbi:MAG: septum formation initiator family protein [Anaerolineae bacterium]|nr:septum formation initiator family protein [Anaerolineae bacterium]
MAKKSTKTQEEQPVIKRLSWFIWGVMAVVIFLLVSAFISSAATNRALRKKLAVLEPMVTQVFEEQATLQVELTRVQSDAYVEQWARERARMTQPGDVLVIPILPTPTITPVPIPTPLPTPTPTPQPFWKAWWGTLTGQGN